MKLHVIRKRYGLYHNTFYGWLRENGMIEKINRSCLARKNALEGVQTLKTKRAHINGGIQINTQVKMDNNKIPIKILSRRLSNPKCDLL